MAGFFTQGPCPGSSTTGVVCAPCPDSLPGNASWVLENATTECAYECNAGFYRAGIGLCRRCTAADLECENGYQRTECTEIQDSHCDVPCENSTKPNVYSHWEKGCAWACDDGYELRVWDYAVFQLHECVPAL
jgi:hypothetical protein